MHRRLDGNEPGLLAYWRFDEPSGTVLADSTPNHELAAIVGNGAWAPSEAPVCEPRPEAGPDAPSERTPDDSPSAMDATDGAPEAADATGASDAPSESKL